MALPHKLSALYLHLKRTLWAAGVETAERDARIIIRQHTDLDWADLIATPDAPISKTKLPRIEFDIERRLSGMPVSRMYGERAFWGLDFKLSPDTLDPRTDTETLVEIAVDRLSQNPPRTILDLGTGTGCILIALLTEWPNATGIGVDKSMGALRVARENARTNNIDARASFICGSWGHTLGGTFDLIVSNPPYISNRDLAELSPEVKNHDPILALDGGEDGLDAYRAIFTEMKKLLSPGGTAFFEIGYDQSASVPRLAGDSGLLVKGVYPDLGGQPRVVEISCGDK
jgi:release factor glutamine methyltransferase